MSRRMNQYKRFRLAVFTAALMSAGCVLAADFPATPPAPGPAPQLNVPTPSAQTLANGLQVISVRRAGLPLVTKPMLTRLRLMREA